MRGWKHTILGTVAAAALAVTSPADNARVSGVVNFTGSASDIDGNETLRSVEVKIGRADWVDARLRSDILSGALPPGDRLVVADLADRVHEVVDASVAPAHARHELARLAEALLPLEGGKRHHLATFCQGDFFGEMAFLDHDPRSADAIAYTDTDLFALSRRSFDAFSEEHKKVSNTLLEGLARTLAIRLRYTDAELRALQA